MIDTVVKIGSMALIRKQDNDIDYNIISRIAGELAPGMVLVSSGATEIGRLDYLKRNSSEPQGDIEEIKADFAAQGQTILMENYRRFMSPEYSMRQLLVEHTHFNDPDKREHIRRFLLRSSEQRAIPIINYNDPVSYEENRKVEIASYRKNGHKIVECIDNDETAAVITVLINAPVLVILTSVEGIYREKDNPDTLVEEISAKSAGELQEKIDEFMQCCHGASRDGAGGAFAKLKYISEPAKAGTRVIIGHARHRLHELLQGTVKCTNVFIK